MRVFRTGVPVVSVALAVFVGLVWAVQPHAQPNTLLSLASGTGIDTARSASLSNSPASSTTTGRNVSGAMLVMRPSQWAVTHAPAANSQATASIAAEASVRHVLDCVSWSGSSGAAVTAANGSVAIRDGATGAGTILATFAIAHTVAAGAGIQTIQPQMLCGLGLVGTTNTAMTAEFNAGVTGETQAINISGYNLQ